MGNPAALERKSLKLFNFAFGFVVTLLLTGCIAYIVADGTPLPDAIMAGMLLFAVALPMLLILAFLGAILVRGCLTVWDAFWSVSNRRVG